MRFLCLMALFACKRDSETFYTRSDATPGTEYVYPSTDDTGSSADSETDSADPDVCEGASDVAVTWYLSADDSNSKAQPAWIRERIEQDGTSPVPPRAYEFLNYYDFDYAPADDGAVRIEPQARLSDTDDNSYELLVAVVAPALAPEDRKAANFTFSLDISGSMSGEGLAREQATLRAIAGSLMAGDVVNVVTWDASQLVQLDSHTISGDRKSVV